MKPRQAAALALVGWYLLLPPTDLNHPSGNIDAPLTQWGKRPTIFRTRTECEHVLDRDRRTTNARNRRIALKFYKRAQCVSADDPRLKAK